ncbi:MAG: four helix bundle protein [bacterium]|nr:four helix bundle protein [bacterium]
MIKNNLLSPPPKASLPIIQKLIAIYKLWHEFLPHFPKTARYTLGNKIDTFFVDVAEYIFTASNLSKEHKLPYLEKAARKLDLLKFFLQISWEIKTLDNKKYIILSQSLQEIGRMLGGWIRQVISSQTSAP